MSSENYRYVCHDAKGQLHVARWFKASSDEDAAAQIASKHPDSRCEIWQGNRLVATLRLDVTSRMVSQSFETLSNVRRVLSETAALTEGPYERA